MAVPAETSARDGSQAGAHHDCHELELATPHGPTQARLYQAIAPVAGVVMVGGVGGGFDTPARDLYPRLASALRPSHVCSLRVRFRDPRDLAEAIVDVVAGIDFLVGAAVRRIALVGHSFGGAVVICAAAARPEVTTVVALATQSHGARAQDLRGRSLLLVHGTEDEVLAPTCSAVVADRARGRCDRRLVAGAGHCLDESADEVFAMVRGFLDAELLGRA